MAWLDRHSVGCYFCGRLFDERKGRLADPYNGNDGGTICPECLNDRIQYVIYSSARNAYWTYKKGWVSQCNRSDVVKLSNKQRENFDLALTGANDAEFVPYEEITPIFIPGFAKPDVAYYDG